MIKMSGMMKAAARTPRKTYLDILWEKCYGTNKLKGSSYKRVINMPRRSGSGDRTRRGYALQHGLKNKTFSTVLRC